MPRLAKVCPFKGDEASLLMDTRKGLKIVDEAVTPKPKPVIQKTTAAKARDVLEASVPGEMAVNGDNLLRIRFAHPVGKPWFVFADDLHALVVAYTVRDEVLQVRVALQ